MATPRIPAESFGTPEGHNVRYDETGAVIAITIVNGPSGMQRRGQRRNLAAGSNMDQMVRSRVQRWNPDSFLEDLMEPVGRQARRRALRSMQRSAETRPSP